MKATKVCHMREAFLNEWRQNFPNVPSPVLESIGDIREGEIVDESRATGQLVSSVRGSVVALDEQIAKLREEIQRKLFVKQFLIGVLGVLDEDNDNGNEALQTEVRKQLSDVNKLRDPDLNQRVAELARQSARTFADTLPAVPTINRVNSGQKQKAEVPVSSHIDSCGSLEDANSKRVSAKGQSGDFSSSKFVSRINIGSENKAPSPRSLSPVSQRNLDYLEFNSASGPNAQYNDKKEEGGGLSAISVQDKSFSSNLGEAEMWRRKKSNAAKAEDELGHGHHNLGSKDNFLAVKSKHIAPTDVHRHPEGITNSPQLSRHFQLLKLTPGFDIVLDSSSGDEDHPSNGEINCRIDTVDSGRASRGSDYDGNSPIMGRGAKNRTGFHSDDVTLSSSPQGNVSTFQIRKVALKSDESENTKAIKPERHEIDSSEHSVASKPAAGVESLANQLREQFISGIHSTNRPKSCEGILESNQFRQGNPDQFKSDSRQTSKKGPVPPPVARKPLRPGSGKKLPPLPVVEGVGKSGPAESRPENTDTNALSCHEYYLNTPNSSVASGTGEQVLSTDVDKRSSGAVIHTNLATENQDFTSSVDQSVHQNENTLDEVRNKSGSPQPSANELGSKCNSSSIGSHGEVVDQEGKSEESKGSFSEPQLLSQYDHKSSSKEVDNSSEPATETQGVSGEDQGEDMSAFKYPKGFDGRRKRNSLGELVEGPIGLSSLLIRKKTDEFHNDNMDDDDSMPSKSPPAVPPKGMYKKFPATSTVPDDSETRNEGGLNRMISSASSDTIVNEFDRKQSFSSDMDVKDAVYSLDDVIQSEGTDAVAQPTAPADRKRLSSTSNYENWTINRAITRSITRDFDSVSDDEELDDTPSSSTTASPCLKRQEPSIGSKDSGLCDDINASENSNMDVSTDSDLASGRVRNLQTIQQMESCEEEDDHADNMFGDEAYTDKDMDAVLASDIVFIRGGAGGPGHHGGDGDDGSQHRISMDRESLDTGSMASSGEEEASTTMDSSYDETDSARDGMLKMRQLVVKGVLDSEKVYLGILSILINYKRVLEASSQSSQPVIHKADIDTIFSNIDTIYEIQTEFVNSLEPKVKNWSHLEQIGETFKIMIFKFESFGNYLTNYQQAVSTIHRCCQESEQFQKLAQQIKVSTATNEITTLEDALFKPVQRVQRNTLVLHDLIKYTPQDHPDHVLLKKALALSQHILEQFASTIPKRITTQENRRLVKSSFLVELVGGQRKLRFMFLFSDLLVCTKRETHRNNKVSFDIKWFTPLSQAVIDTKFAYTDINKPTKKDDIDSLKSKIRALKKEMRVEMRKMDDKDKQRLSFGGAPKSVEKLQKKINTLEAQLILASPKLPFKVSLEKGNGKHYTLLMSTDYEREEWKETIATLCSRADNSPQAISSIFVQDLINSVKETPQVNKIGNVLLQKDEEPLTGILNVTIHTVNGLTEACDTYCCLEMDSFGHFFMKARTHICEASRDPAWNEDFELELEGSQTLRILCFKKEPGDQGDTLKGRGALELSKHWLKGSFQEKTLSMNEISLVISVRHTPVEKTMQRTPSRSGSAVFGVKISSCARRESKTVPTIVTACIQEVEKRGLDEVGIYRVSGVTSDLQTIKKLFDKNVKAGVAAITDVDIHAVTGVLKLYFRELPEPLFTEHSYQRFVDTLKLSDEEAKAQCMLSLLHDLPDTNYYTIVALLEHLIKVAKNVGENKMSIHNLSTVFGPTLLAPATKQQSSDPLELMCKGAEQVMRQSGVVNYLLGLAVSGRSLRRSAQSGEASTTG